MVAITWLGFSVIGQTEVLVEARNKAWKQRFKNAADNPLCFPILPEHDLPVLPKYVASEDYVTESVSKRVEVSPVFDGIPGPEASHTILAGSWDYEAMPFNKPPDFKLMAKAALIGAFGNVLDLLSSADDPLGLLGKLKDVGRESKRIESETETSKTNVGKDDSPADAGSGTGTGASGDEKTTEQAKAESEADLEKHKEELLKRFKALGGKIDFQDVVTPVSGELEAAEDAMSDAQTESAEKSQIARLEPDPDKKKQLQAEAARANRKYELAKITLERLKAECIDVTKEAEALDINRLQLNATLGVVGF
jgi:hypothetical protein